MGIEAEIRTRLESAFHPDHLEVINESHKHAGHSGDDGTGESHFHVVIRVPAFAELSRISRHRAVHKALGADLTTRIHALALDISA